MASPDDIKYCFQLFAQDGGDTISAADAGTALRTLGRAPSGEELEELLGGATTVDFEKFKEMYNNTETPELEDVIEAFSTFDANNVGYMPLKELQHLMKSLGEGLSDEQIAEMTKHAEPDVDQQVNYRHFAEKMIKNL